MHLPGEEVHRTAESVASEPPERFLRSMWKHHESGRQSRDEGMKLSFVLNKVSSAFIILTVFK